MEIIIQHLELIAKRLNDKLGELQVNEEFLSSLNSTEGNKIINK